MVFMRRNGGSSAGCDIVLCETCAGGRGIIAGKGSLELNIDDLLGAGLDPALASGSASACPSCGLELGALKRERRLGCADCAVTFGAEIAKALGRSGPVDTAERLFSSGGSPAPRYPAGIDERRLRRELEAALRSEDYEKAARLRDELSGSLEAGTSPAPPPADFPLDAYASAALAGPDDDVVLHSSARVYRDLVGLPFPVSPRGPSAPSRNILLERLLSSGEWRAYSMPELGHAARRSLAERGILSRGYAADEGAVLLSSVGSPTYALLDEGDHLRVRSIVPGLDGKAALEFALACVDRLGAELDFAKSADIGWICARLEDCGLAASLSATVHIPAIAAAGMRDRLLRALLADGVVVRGFYSSGEDSSGSVYELGIEAAAVNSLGALLGAFGSALATVVEAERRARAEISERGRDALEDAEGRAFGIARHFKLVGAEEAYSLVSALRLAVLRGSLSGVDHRALGGLLLAMGPGSIAVAEGARELPSTSSQDAGRAVMIKRALAGADYRV